MLKMKKILIYSLMCSAIFAVTSCKEEGGNLPDIEYIPQPLITKDVTLDPAILDTDPESFQGKVTVDLYFDDGERPQKFDLVVMKNGNASNVKTIQADITTFPTDVEITGQQLTDLFGETIVSGDQFDIGVNITAQSGKLYEAYPVVGAGYGSGVASLPGSSLDVRYSAICGFDMDAFLGDGVFEVVADDWGDYSEGQIVTVTKLEDNSFSIEAAVPTFDDFVVDINPADNSATIASTMIADANDVTAGYGGGGAYGSLTVSTGGAVSLSFVDPCVDEIQVNIQYVLSNYGNQGAYILKLKKVTE